MKQSVVGNPGIRSLDFKNGKILVGTRGSEVVVVDKKGKLLEKVVQGHSPQQSSTYAEVWGLTCHPTKQIFASAGSDGTVKVWDEFGLVKSSKKMNSDITAISFGNQEEFIACGDRAGHCYLIDLNTMEKTSNGYQGSNSKKNMKNPSKMGTPWVEGMAVAPQDNFVAWGAHMGLAYVEIGKITAMKVTKYKSLQIGQTAITQMDWSEDGTYVSYCAGEPLAVNVEAGTRANPSECADCQWASWSQIFGWGV